MRKVHISLVGRETAPVYLGIIQANPDLVILIHSSDTEQETERIIKESASFNIEKREFDPMDLRKIFISIEKLKQDLLSDDIISLNLVGGTKFWSLAFYSAFNQMENVEIYLIDQQNKVWDFKTQSAKRFSFDMERNFRLYGNPLVKYTPFTEFTDKDFQLIEDIEKYRAYNYDDFTKLTVAQNNKQKNEISRNENKITLPSESSIEWNQSGFILLSLFKKKDNTIYEIEFNSPHSKQLIFNYAWFELKIAKILSQFYAPDNIYMNCRFPSYRGGDKNEVDIVINTGDKLLFVECKVKINAITDIDKFRTVVRNYGGKSSKALFITDANMNAIEIEKCNESNIAHFSLQDYKGKRLKTLQQDLKMLLNNFIGLTNK
ncbi:MAG: DUF1887 family protein [Bacteroidales bacterium]|nr:DUF1887 family protein [Bacteroidales bacterium]